MLAWSAAVTVRLLPVDRQRTNGERWRYAGAVAQVRRCRMLACPMWPYRMGTNPFRAAGQGVSRTNQRFCGPEAGYYAGIPRGMGARHAAATSKWSDRHET